MLTPHGTPEKENLHDPFAHVDPHRPTRTGAVVLANTFRKDVAEELALELLAGVCDREPLPAVPWRPAVAPPPDLAPLTGRWWWTGRRRTWRGACLSTTTRS